jgi:hypothetical protein
MQPVSCGAPAARFEDIELLWQALCDEAEAADQEIYQCLYAGGASAREAGARLARARRRCSLVQCEMLRFLDAVDQTEP